MTDHEDRAPSDGVTADGSFIDKLVAILDEAGVHDEEECDGPDDLLDEVRTALRSSRGETAGPRAKKRRPAGAAEPTVIIAATAYGPPASNPPDYGAGLAAGYAEGLRDGRRGR